MVGWIQRHDIAVYHELGFSHQDYRVTIHGFALPLQSWYEFRPS